MGTILKIEHRWNIFSRMSVDDETEFMEEDNDRGGEEGEGMDQHKSVIVHLIKQVRIGMDLTKGKNFKISGIFGRCLFGTKRSRRYEGVFLIWQ